MAKSLESVLGFMPLTESLRATSSGIPNPFPPELFEVKPANRILGDRAKYIRISGERRTSTKAVYGSPARRRTLRDVADQNVRMMHSFESFAVDMVMVQKLMAFEKYVADEGMDWLRYQFEEAARRQINTRVATTASVLSSGAIFWDQEGNLLPTAAGASETYSFNVPASHQNQLNGIIPSSESWALANSPVPDHLRALKDFMAQETGLYEGITALYGRNVPGYITRNNDVQSFLARNGVRNEQFVASNEIPAGLFEIDWRPVHVSFYEDLNGVNQPLWDPDLVVFIPKLAQPNKMSWWAMFEGSFPVPRSLEVQQDPMAALRNFETVYGQFAYSTVQLSPPGIECHLGDVWLPGIRNEKAIFQAKVAF